MRLAAVDRRCPALVRAATVAGVQNYRVKLHFDGWNAAYDYQVEDTSLDIFPYDFVLETGHDIEPPLEMLASCKAPKSCPQPGCYGHGHISGALYSTHSKYALVQYLSRCYFFEILLHSRIGRTLTLTTVHTRTLLIL